MFPSINEVLPEHDEYGKKGHVLGVTRVYLDKDSNTAVCCVLFGSYLFFSYCKPKDVFS